MNGYTYIAVPGQNPISLTPTNNTLNVTGTGALVVTTNPLTNTLTFNLNSTNFSVTNFTVSGTLTLAPTTTGNLDNIIIGATTPAAGTFTTLTATGAVNLTPAGGNVTISPSGSGTVIINPAVTGTVDNVNIGVNTPSTANFTAITLTTTQPTSSSSVVTKGYVAALSAAYGVALS